MINNLTKYRTLIIYGGLEPSQEKQVASALKNAGAAGISILIAGLRGDNHDEFCKKTLVEIGAPAVPALIRALRKGYNGQKMGSREYLNLKEGVAYALGEIGGREAAEALALQTIREPGWADFHDSKHISNILKAARKCEYDRIAVARELIRELEGLGENDRSRAAHIILKLGLAGGKEAVEAIFAYCEKGRNANVGEFALRLAGGSAIEKLVGRIRQSPEESGKARWAIGILMKIEPRDRKDIEIIQETAKEIKNEIRKGKGRMETVRRLSKLYSKWGGILNERATGVLDAKDIPLALRNPGNIKPDEIRRARRLKA